MSNCNCGAWLTNIACSCNANPQLRCDSSAYDSSCTDLGQGEPLCMQVKCAAPVYTPIPGVVGVWNGTEWLLDANSSSVASSSVPVSSSIPPPPPPSP